MQIKKMTYYPKARKLLLPLLVVCLFVICGCGNLYNGEENVFDPDRDETIEEESIPVMVAFSDPYYNILSRGVGKIDPEDEYFHGKMNPVDEEGNPDNENKPRFFVYAFRKNKGDYTITRAEDKEMCLIDGSCGTQADWAREKDPTLEGHGKWAYYNGNGSFINWHFLDDKVYYSNDSQMTPFEFFAYFHDGAATDKATRTADRISFPVKIDGSQDLMCGTAELTEEQLKTIDEITDEAEKQKIKEFYYSTYTGRRNIWPILKLKHQLAYVKFNLIAGNAYEDAVLVNDIKLETHTEGTFVVASIDKKIGATFNGNGIEQLPLRDTKTGKAIPAESTDENEDTWAKRNILLERNEDGSLPPATIAGELLIPAGNDVILHTWLSNKDTGWKIEHTPYSLKDKVGENGEGFMAGREYNLNITVYGPKQISIEVKASPWRDGGDIDIDIEENN